DSVLEAPEDGYAQEGADTQAIPFDGENGWFFLTDTFVTPANAILPYEMRTLIIKTGSGNYAKLEIQSYYKGNPDPLSEAFINTDTRPDAGYYTFRYRIQPNGSRSF
ncbi:MAG: HmuY family protein, partial [Bacteroidota bacterium]